MRKINKEKNTEYKISEKKKKKRRKNLIKRTRSVNQTSSVSRNF